MKSRAAIENVIIGFYHEKFINPPISPRMKFTVKKFYNADQIKYRSSWAVKGSNCHCSPLLSWSVSHFRRRAFVWACCISVFKSFSAWQFHVVFIPCKTVIVPQRYEASVNVKSIISVKVYSSMGFMGRFALGVSDLYLMACMVMSFFLNVGVKSSHLSRCFQRWLWPEPPASAWMCKWSRRKRGPPRRWTQATETPSSPPEPELLNIGPTEKEMKG